MIINSMKILKNLEEQAGVTSAKTPEELEKEKKEKEEQAAQAEQEAEDARSNQLTATIANTAVGQLVGAGVHTGMRGAAAAGRGAVQAGKWLSNKAIANPKLGLGTAGLAAGAGLGYLAYKKLKERQREKQQ
jgi:hypothetical protein